MHARLRFDPLGCVVTIVAGEGEQADVLEVAGPASELVRERAGESEHFRDLHGSVVFVGARPPRSRRGVVAAVIDLPEGRVEATGSAALSLSGGQVRADCELTTREGQSFRLRLLCRSVQRGLAAANQSAS